MSLSTNGFITLLCVLPFIIWLAIKSSGLKKQLVILVVFLVVTSGALHILASKNPKVWDESLGFFLENNPYVIEEVSDASNKNTYSLELFENRAYAAENAFELPELPAPAWGPGTGRLYIWKETIELVKDRPLFGYGLDSLVYHFPHDQLEARGNLNEVTVVDKPHSVYVGVLFGTGVIGFILFMILVVAVFKTIVLKVKNNSSDAVLAIVSLGFLIQALFNDTTPAIMCVFFVAAGILMRQNDDGVHNKL